MGSSASRIAGSVTSARAIGHALPLAAGELVGLVVHAVAQADGLQRLGGLVLGVAQPGVEQRQLDVLQRLMRGSRLKVWKTKPIRRLRISASRSLRQLRDVLAGQDVASRVGPVQAAQDVHQRALAAAGGAGDGDHLALGDLQARRRPARGRSCPPSS